MMPNVLDWRHYVRFGRGRNGYCDSGHCVVRASSVKLGRAAVRQRVAATSGSFFNPDFDEVADSAISASLVGFLRGAFKSESHTTARTQADRRGCWIFRSSGIKSMATLLFTTYPLTPAASAAH